MQFHIQDFGLTIFWAVMWFIASVAWAAESNQLQDDLEDLANCERNDNYQTSDTDYQTFVQVNISIVSTSHFYVFFILLIINFRYLVF